VLVDITGLPSVDTDTARHLFGTTAAVKLLGARVVLTGIRPEIAQTVIGLDVDLSGIITRSSLASGLELAFHELRLRVVRT
jgi:rsbT co-antagonist protein RsbR